MGRRRPLGSWGPDGATRLVVATVDPATLPDKATWYLATNLPRPGGPREAESPHPAANLAEIVRIYGIRHWIEQSYKQGKDELGWADFQVRSDAAIRRHQTLVNCAFSFCWDTWFAEPAPPDADAPLGRSSFQEEAIATPDQIREAERSLAAAGADLHVVVAIDEATNEVVGLTQVVRYPHRLEIGYQRITAVLADHRGYNLGLAMKGQMMRVLTRAWPELKRIHTNTSAENEHMIGVNIALDYRTHREMMWMKTLTENLAKALGSS